MEKHTDDIAVLFPNRAVAAQGEQIIVRPFFFGELPAVMKMIYPILTAAGLSSLIRIKPDAEDKTKFVTSINVPENIVDVLAVALMDSGEPLIELVAFAIKKDRAWFNTLSIAEGVDLTSTWFEVNRDFFVQQVLPKILARLKNNSVGLTPLQSSSKTDIVEETSTNTP